MTRLAFALNVESGERAFEWLERIGRKVDFYKIQMDLFGRAGPKLVRRFVEQDVDVFLDLKFHDIPSVVGKAVSAVAELGVKLLTVHATGGQKMLEAAAEAARRAGEKRPQVLGVTVLTSLDAAELARVTGATQDVSERVLALARLAKESGCDGVVASPHEIAAIKRACGREFMVVTPGIRLTPPGPGDDQSRFATPAQAASDGADCIVVGRPIYQAPDPVAAIAAIRAELGGDNG